MRGINYAEITAIEEVDSFVYLYTSRRITLEDFGVDGDVLAFAHSFLKL